MKKVSVVVIGFGDRAVAYTKYALDNPDRLEVKAVIDPDAFRRSLAKEMFSLPDDMLFNNMEDCLKLGKIADAVINATMDELHIPTAIPFLKLGYDMLLEKPITNNKEDLLKLKKIADENGCKLMICHVLRYTPFYLKTKGSGTRCLVDCQVEKECPYSCKKLLIDNEYFAQYTFRCIPKKYEDLTVEEKVESLKTDNPMGRCIYKTDADIVDRQALIVEFENGSIATHSMISGVARPGRNILVVGTKGEIQGFLEDNKFIVRTYNPANCLWNERVEEITNVVQGDGHSGGDSRLVNDFVNMELGLPRSISSTVIEDSINGHLLVYAADESLDNGGISVKIND